MSESSCRVCHRERGTGKRRRSEKNSKMYVLTISRLPPIPGSRLIGSPCFCAMQPNAPKRPLSAFLLYCQDARSKTDQRLQQSDLGLQWK
jgi:hypothetical protein